MSAPLGASSSPGLPSPSLGTSGAGSGTVVGYKSTVDNFSLSFLEWLPVGFVRTNSYPLAVYLHGMGGPGLPVLGGVGGVSVPASVTENSTKAGFILISLNTRTADGFYADTSCGGPQEQDVLDAIAREKALRHVSLVDLIGFSMGTVGALSIAAHHPGLVSAIALDAPLTDLFQIWAYSGAIRNLALDLCHSVPTPRNLATDRFIQYLSPARFAPKNFSGIPIYVTAGGLDTSAPNNFTLWPYAEVNSTFVNSSCITAPRFGERAPCTTTFWSLEKAHPTNYSFRFVYEASAVHSAFQLAGADLFGFLVGTLTGGFYQADFPADTVTIAPTPP